jgi:Tol biopolymer transport system component
MTGGSRRLIWTWSAAAIALAGFCAGPAHAQVFGQNKVQYRHYDWKSIRADHFEIYFYSGLDSVAMRVLDLAEKSNEELSARMGHKLSKRVPIILYGSHNDFSQTNITPELIDGGTGGFTEALRNRVVLPFSGSYEDLRHVVVHELVHAFMFDMLFGGNLAGPLSSQGFFNVPLWFAEGMAEYFSLGMEPNAEMFMRDGSVEDYLPPLPWSGGYLVYKQGQTALAYLVGRYGDERLRSLLRALRRMRNFDRAFERTMDMTVMGFDEQFREYLRKEYWPTVAHKEGPEKFARRLTSHRTDQSNVNSGPAVSPQGDRIAYFSDRRQYTDVYIMSAFDGKVERRVIRGELNVKFEAIPSFRSSLTWSPDGNNIALVAKSQGYDRLYVVSTEKGHVTRRFDFPCEALFYPAWSPVSDSIVVAGVKDGRTDLWMVDVGSGEITRLTSDIYDEKEPAWSPDGSIITFSSDRVAGVVLHPRRQQRGYGAYGLFNLNLATGSVGKLIDTFGDDTSPAWSPDGESVAFISDRSGAYNVYLYEMNDGAIIQLTDVIGGITSLSWSRENDRIVFASFDRGGWDIFAVKEPLSIDSVVDRLRREMPGAVLTPEEALEPAPGHIRVRPHAGALAPVWPDSVTALAGEGEEARGGIAEPEPEPGIELSGSGLRDTIRAELPESPEPPPWASRETVAGPPRAAEDTVARIVSTIPLVERGGPFALPDSVLSQEPEPYQVKLSPDYVGGGFYASTGYGLVGSTQLLFSDFLGDHSLFVSTDLFTGSLEETNALVLYNYLPRRWDVGFGVFHFKDYYSSRVTQLGENFNRPRLFSDRSFGALMSLAYPFDRFRRVELNLTQMFVERQFYERDVFGVIVATEQEYRTITSPSVSLVGDNTLFGYYGPVNGGRYNFTVAPSFPILPNGMEYHTFTLDARRYWDLTRGYTFVNRVLLGVSEGMDAQTFRVGGFATLRGYPDFDLVGTRMAILNTEFRFPFIQQLGLVGPVPIGVFNMRGAAFADFGAVWTEDRGLRFTESVEGGLRLASPKLGFGGGVRSSMFFMIFKFDVAWATDFMTTTQPRVHFSIGPEF